jgi:hypothetical protein
LPFKCQCWPCSTPCPQQPSARGSGARRWAGKTTMGNSHPFTASSPAARIHGGESQWAQSAHRPRTRSGASTVARPWLMRMRTAAPSATLPLEPASSRTMNRFPAVATAKWVPLTAAAVPLMRPAWGPFVRWSPCRLSPSANAACIQWPTWPAQPGRSPPVSVSRSEVRTRRHAQRPAWLRFP